MKLFFFVSMLVIGMQARSQRLVLPGDNPDPSVVKIGDRYWASATTSNWAPVFPILSSTDLLNWKDEGHVFMKVPEWADYYFWAPEITYDNGRVYIYYSAHKKGGNLCVAVASADRPEGPYRDHGPLVCEEVGSIDAFPIRDESGKLYLIWKEDANSVGKPTPIWIQEMNEERTALLGQKKEIMRNDAAWEANLVEGVSIRKHGDYYYAFYAAAGCCGAACTYGVGVARAKSPLGPWEKYGRNPVLTNTKEWTCPGHGTPVEKDGRFYFLYHGYDKAESIFTGRQGLLIEYKVTSDGWIEFVPEPAAARTPAPNISDEFSSGPLGPQWQWSVFDRPEYKIKGNRLHLEASSRPAGTFVGTKAQFSSYIFQTEVKVPRRSTKAGLSLIGDDNNLITLWYGKDSLSLTLLKDGKETTVRSMAAPKGKRLHLQAVVTENKDLRFLYSTDGRTFVPVTEGKIDAGYLPPWDRALRAGLSAKGRKKAVFERFTMTNNRTK